jgi:hypothetical protein
MGFAGKAQDPIVRTALGLSGSPRCKCSAGQELRLVERPLHTQCGGGVTAADIAGIDPKLLLQGNIPCGWIVALRRHAAWHSLSQLVETPVQR